MKRSLPLTFLAVVALAGCGGGSPATPGAGGTAGTSLPGGGGGDAASISCNDGVVGTAATIIDFAFQPATVAADADDTVNWTNTGSARHTVTFDNGKDCGTLDSGDMVTVLFLAPGSYAYHCAIHSSMKGTVTVN